MLSLGIVRNISRESPQIILSFHHSPSTETIGELSAGVFDSIENHSLARLRQPDNPISVLWGLRKAASYGEGNRRKSSDLNMHVELKHDEGTFRAP